jgi:hypothetical protein
MDETTTAPALKLTVDTPVIAEFGNGTRDYAITDEIQVGVRSDGYVYWASAAGWDWVIDNARLTGTKVIGRHGFPTFWEDSYYLAHPTR